MSTADQNPPKGDAFRDDDKYGKALIGQPGGIPVQDRQTEVDQLEFGYLLYVSPLCQMAVTVTPQS